MIDMPGSTSGVATIKLQYSTDGGFRWFTESNNVEEIIATGTISGTEVLGWVVNETPKNKLYRWFVTSWTSGSIYCYLKKNAQPVHTFSKEKGIYLFVNPAAPSSGIDGDGAQIAGPGSIYINSVTGVHYANEGNSRLPMWVDM